MNDQTESTIRKATITPLADILERLAGFQAAIDHLTAMLAGAYYNLDLARDVWKKISGLDGANYVEVYAPHSRPAQP